MQWLLTIPTLPTSRAFHRNIIPSTPLDSTALSSGKKTPRRAIALPAPVPHYLRYLVRYHLPATDPPQQSLSRFHCAGILTGRVEPQIAIVETYKFPKHLRFSTATAYLPQCFGRYLIGRWCLRHCDERSAQTDDQTLAIPLLRFLAYRISHRTCCFSHISRLLSHRLGPSCSNLRSCRLPMTDGFPHNCLGSGVPAGG